MVNVKQALLNILPKKIASKGNTIVRLESGSREPVTPVEQLAVSLLASKGPMPLHTLAERVASELYRQELGKGAQVLDIGLFGSRLFLGDVIGEIEARNGTLWRIENQSK
jgi:hypothetical protein